MEQKELSGQIIHYQTVLKRLAYKFTSDPEEIQDLIQETFLRAMKYIDQLLNNPKAISWLYVIMKNIYINSYRQQQQRFLYNTQQQKELQSTYCREPFTHMMVDEKFAVKDIENSLEQFPSDYCNLFKQFMDGYKYRELAELYGIPEGTIKSRIHIIRKNLQKKFSRYASM